MSAQPSPDLDAAGPDARARIALRAALALLVPLARWLVRNGVLYTSFAPALKAVFIEAARRELAAHGGKITDSALSVLSGVQRRDIRAMVTPEPDAARPKWPSAASQLVTRWLTDPAWRGADERPLALPKNGEARSFDRLAHDVSSDVHPRTLLAELQRLGVVAVDGDTVRLDAQAFVPQQGFDEMAGLMRDNVADHLAAAAHNIDGQGDKFLEQSLFGSGLAPASAAALGQLARRLWKQAFEQMAAEAGPRVERESQDGSGSMRMRFGAYFYAEPIEPVSTPDAGDTPEAASPSPGAGRGAAPHPPAARASRKPEPTSSNRRSTR